MAQFRYQRNIKMQRWNGNTIFFLWSFNTSVDIFVVLVHLLNSTSAEDGGFCYTWRKHPLLELTQFSPQYTDFFFVCVLVRYLQPFIIRERRLSTIFSLEPCDSQCRPEPLGGFNWTHLGRTGCPPSPAHTHTAMPSHMCRANSRGRGHTACIPPLAILVCTWMEERINAGLLIHHPQSITATLMSSYCLACFPS